MIGEMGKEGGKYKRNRDVDKTAIKISEKATTNNTINYTENYNAYNSVYKYTCEILMNIFHLGCQ